MSTRPSFPRRCAALTLICCSPILAQCWGPLVPTGTAPPTRGIGVTFTSDQSGGALLFGGAQRTNGGRLNLSDTWYLRNATRFSSPALWVERSAVTTPPARSDHGAAYDPASDRLIVFGGCGGGCAPALNDVWVLDHATAGTPSWMEVRLDPVLRPGRVSRSRTIPRRTS